MPIIEDLNKKKKDGYFDWVETDNPIPNSSDTVMIPADGNHPVFTSGGTVIPPVGKSTGEKKASGKKFFY